MTAVNQNTAIKKHKALESEGGGERVRASDTVM